MKHCAHARCTSTPSVHAVSALVPSCTPGVFERCTQRRSRRFLGVGNVPSLMQRSCHPNPTCMVECNSCCHIFYAWKKTTSEGKVVMNLPRTPCNARRLRHAFAASPALRRSRPRAGHQAAGGGGGRAAQPELALPRGAPALVPLVAPVAQRAAGPPARPPLLPARPLPAERLRRVSASGRPCSAHRSLASAGMQST